MEEEEGWHYVVIKWKQKECWSLYSLCAYLVDDVTELHEGHANQAIIPGEAVVFDADVKLKTVKMLLIPNNTERE